MSQIKIYRDGQQTVLDAPPATSGAKSFDIFQAKGTAVRVDIELGIALGNAGGAPILVTAADEAAIKSKILVSIQRKAGNPVVPPVPMEVLEEALVIHEGELPETIVGESIAAGATETVYLRCAWSFRDKAQDASDGAIFFEPMRRLHQAKVDVLARPVCPSGLVVAGISATVCVQFVDEMPILSAYRSLRSQGFKTDAPTIGDRNDQILDAWFKANLDSVAYATTPDSLQVTTKVGNEVIYNNQPPRVLRDVMGGQRGPWSAWLSLSGILTPIVMRALGWDFGDVLVGPVQATVSGGGTLGDLPIRWTVLEDRDAAAEIGISPSQVAAAGYIAKRMDKTRAALEAVKSQGAKANEMAVMIPGTSTPKMNRYPIVFPTYTSGDNATEKNAIGRTVRARIGGREK